MSLGTGIFLSSLLLAIVALYGLTKDRWGWRRFMKRFAFVVLGLVALTAVSIGGYYVWENIPTPVTRQTEYAGVRLGMSPDEVMYVKGYPPTVLTSKPGDEWKDFFLVVETSKLEKGKKVTDYRNWGFKTYESELTVAFDEARTKVAVIRCFSNDKRSRCPAIAGVQDGDSEQTVIRKLGPKHEQRIEGVTKSIVWPDLGIRLHLTTEEVFMLDVVAADQLRR